jgi:ATP-dependent RNA helicase DDX21
MFLRLDHFLAQDLIVKGHLNLKLLKFRVLDEADEMLNMGFVDDVELILGM